MLDSRWTFIDPDGGSTLDLTVNPGWSRMTTISPPERDLMPELHNAPRLMMLRVSGDFTVETKVMATMDENDEGAGISVWKDDGHFVRLERMSRTMHACIRCKALAED